MAQYFYNQIPPYCRPVECSEIYPLVTLLPSLSYINICEEDPETGIWHRPDSIHHGMCKVNNNMYEIEQVLSQFAETYGKYREKLALVYTTESFYAPALSADPPTAFSRPIEVGDVLYYMTSSVEYPLGCWNYAIATSGYESEAIAVVSELLSADGNNCFALTLNGYVSSDALSLIPGVTYFLSDLLPGKVSMSNPNSPGMISKPIFSSVSTNEMIVDIKRGVQIANFNVWP